MNGKEQNPLENIFYDIETIIGFMEVKNEVLALYYETEETRGESDLWIRALTEDDTHTTYRYLWEYSMFQEVDYTTKYIDYQYWCDHPYETPYIYHETLLKRCRELIISSYEEKNNYYRMVSALPNHGETDAYVYLTEETASIIGTNSTTPVHMMSTIIQNELRNTSEYNDMDKSGNYQYLKYIGMYKVDVFVARQMKDFDIIRYPGDTHNINQYVLSDFKTLYKHYRDYVMFTLYNRHLEGIFDNYRTFMGMLIYMYTTMQLSNKGIESLNSKKFLDDSVVYTILSMYNIPNSLILPNDIRRDLASRLQLLVHHKGTDQVYKDIADVLRYTNVTIYKLLLVRGQQFDQRNNNSTDYGEDNNYENRLVDPYFIQVDIDDDNVYKSVSSNECKSYTYHEIIDSDPTWWDLADTQDMIINSNYTISDSKYIVVESVINQMDYMFETIYFAKLVLDNKSYTQSIMISVPSLFGTNTVSLYDIFVFLTAATCMNMGLSGSFYDGDELLATAGFNVYMNFDEFIEYVNNCTYVDKEQILSAVEDLSITESVDLNRLYDDTILPLREWLEDKIATTFNKAEYLEYEFIYRALFTYDINNNTLVDDFKLPLFSIMDAYDIEESDMIAYKHFYPHTISGNAYTIDTILSSSYSLPFLSQTKQITWYIHIIIDTIYGEEDRGYVYFYDILNCSDCRELTNSSGNRIFMDYEDDSVGWVINQKAIDKAFDLLNALDVDELSTAYFQIATPILNSGGSAYSKDEYLPSKIRVEMYKNILIDKLQMDLAGLIIPPSTYAEYLSRNNSILYNLLVGSGTFDYDKDQWLNNIMTIILAVEVEVDIHLKYIEQSIVGDELYFKPLITLINHFKSTFVTIAKSNINYQFSDKMDIGGNSNMLKIFDLVDFIIQFVVMKENGFDNNIAITDAIHRLLYKACLYDRSMIISNNSTEINKRDRPYGSLRIVDECKCYKNNKSIEEVDPVWLTSEQVGRWEDETDITMADYIGVMALKMPKANTSEWKKYVEIL